MTTSLIVSAADLIRSADNVFRRTVDGIEIELHLDQPARSDGSSARATWSVWEAGDRQTHGHLCADGAVRAWRKGRAFEAWWNRPRL